MATKPAPQSDDDLNDFTVESFTALGATRLVYRLGVGPAVIIMAEIPGITPKVAAFARDVARLGCTVVLPDLFGEAGAAPTPTRVATVAGKMCISREFTLLASGKSSPIVSWLRELATHEHGQCGGRGVGAVGMCLTGGFALAMMVAPAVVAPVLSQPSLPLAVTKRQKSDLHLSNKDLQVVVERIEREDLCVLGLRFTEDRLVPPQRFQRLKELLGDRFISVEIDSSAGNVGGFANNAHSVLTEQRHEESYDQVLQFLHDQLLVGSPT